MSASPPDKFEVIEDEHDGMPLVRPIGEVDVSTAPQLRSRLIAHVQPNTTAILDLSEVAFMDSSGVHVLVDAKAKAAALGATLIIRNPPDLVRRLFNLTGTEDRFDA